MNILVKINNFINELSKFYEFEVGYDDSSLLLKNIKNDDEYSKKHKEYLSNTPFQKIIEDFSEGLFQSNSKKKFICYLIIEKGLVDDAYIYKEIREGIGNEYAYWHDLYKSPMVLIGYDIVDEEIVLNFNTGIGSVNWRIFSNMKKRCD